MQISPGKRKKFLLNKSQQLQGMSEIFSPFAWPDYFVHVILHLSALMQFVGLVIAVTASARTAHQCWTSDGVEPHVKPTHV